MYGIDTVWGVEDSSVERGALNLTGVEDPCVETLVNLPAMLTLQDRSVSDG